MVFGKCLPPLILLLWMKCSGAENTITCTSKIPRSQQMHHDKAGFTSRKVNVDITFDDDDLAVMPSITFQGLDGVHPVLFRKSSNLRLSTFRSSTTSWFGDIEGSRSGSATIVKSQNGDYAASFSIDDVVYQMNSLPNGTVTMNVVNAADFPDEEHEGDTYEENSSIGTANNAHPEDAHIGVNEVGDRPHQRLLSHEKKLRGNDKANKKEGVQTTRKLLGTTEVDVLVIYTQNAMCAEAGESPGCSSSNKGPIESLINLAEAETNGAFQASGISTRINVVAKHLDTSGFNELNGDFRYSLDALRFSGGQLSYVEDLRDEVNADLVAMIIDQSGSCGRGLINGPYSVTARSCATGYYSFGHELAHGFGCHHDRNNSQQTQAFAHGWQDPQGRFRSIMAYNCPGSCPRVQRFSAPDVSYRGNPIGDASNDCARRIDERSPTVASWRTASNSNSTGTCSDSPSGWYDSDGSPFNCAWYAQDDNCAKHGDSFRNFRKTANEACCSCGGGIGSSSGTESGNNQGTCSNSPQGWHDSDGETYDCDWYSQGIRCQQYGDSYANFGATANQACCSCGGGSSTSTSDIPMLRTSSTSTCTDIPDWHDSENETFDCRWYAQGDNCERFGDGFANMNHTAKEACCKCGGGTY